MNAVVDTQAFRLPLPAVLDMRQASEIAQAMRSVRGRPLIVEAQHVERLGGLCLQVLLAADLTWSRDGVPMSLESPSRAFRDAAHLFNATSLLARYKD